MQKRHRCDIDTRKKIKVGHFLNSWEMQRCWKKSHACGITRQMISFPLSLHFNVIISIFIKECKLKKEMCSMFCRVGKKIQRNNFVHKCKSIFGDAVQSK